MRIQSYSLSAIGALLVTVSVSGCATGSSDRSAMTEASSTVRNTSDLVFQYRQQARELRDMARRLEMEADVYAQRQEDEQALKKRDLAKDMRAAAETADERAREYRRQLPHNQVY